MRLSAKYFPAILLSLLLSSCQRNTTPAVAETKTEEKSAEKERYREVQLQKESNYKKSGQDPAIQRALKDQTEQLDYKTFYERGSEKHNSGDFQGAITDFGKCIALNPGFSDAWNFRGMSKYKSGDSAGACSDWNKAVGLGLSQAQDMVTKYCK